MFLNHSLASKVFAVVKDCFKPSMKASLWILKLMVPISLLVVLMQQFGIIDQISKFTSPLFNFVGLPGEAALVYISAALVNVYSAIAVMSAFPFDARAITMLAISSLIAHNLIIETAVQKKTGSSAWAMLATRVLGSIASLVVMNWLLPNTGSALALTGNVQATTLAVALKTWLTSSILLIAKVVVIVFVLNLLQQVLRQLGVIELLSKALRPLLALFGLPSRTSFLWIVANTLGLAYGSAVMVGEVENDNITHEEADLLNYHVAISHSNLEDLLLFAAVGASVLWMLAVRLIFALIVVWGVRLTLYRKHKFASE